MPDFQGSHAQRHFEAMREHARAEHNALRARIAGHPNVVQILGMADDRAFSVEFEDGSTAYHDRNTGIWSPGVGPTRGWHPERKTWVPLDEMPATGA